MKRSIGLFDYASDDHNSNLDQLECLDLLHKRQKIEQARNLFSKSVSDQQITTTEINEHESTRNESDRSLISALQQRFKARSSTHELSIDKNDKKSITHDQSMIRCGIDRFFTSDHGHETLISRPHSSNFVQTEQ